MDRQSRIDAIVAEARSYVGVRWRHRGRSRFGIDCIGVIVKSLAAGGVHMRDRLDYGREPWRDGLSREMVDHFGQPVDGEWLPGDVAVMCGIGQPEPGHVGIIAEHSGYLTLIHSYNALSTETVTEHRIDDEWRRRIVAVYRAVP